jgi:excisionase family DNA binding protein
MATLMREKELAKRLKLNYNTLRNWRRDRKMPYIKIGGTNVFYPLDQVKTWLIDRCHSEQRHYFASIIDEILEGENNGD